MNSISRDSAPNDRPCEAVGCFANASNVIYVDVGNIGKVALFLCKNCVTEFEDH